MRQRILITILATLIVCLASATGSAQGRGRGQGRNSNVFANGQSRFDGRSRSQDWKCNVFVNCHDARDGRVDGRGPNRVRTSRSYIYGRGTNVGYGRRYSTNDYWQRRHFTYIPRDLNMRSRYRNSRDWRNR